MQRLPVRLAAAVGLAVALSACEGPTGPIGPPGPGTRLVLNGTTDTNGEAVVDLPSEAGTIADPPAVTCYLSGTGDAWLIIGFDTDTDTDAETATDNNFLTACILDQATGGNLIVAIVGAPVNWQFRVVVIY
jgi:hypothetical protein